MKELKKMLINLYSKYKCVIYSSLIFSFITHFYYFTKRLGNEDDLSYLIFSDSALTSGRWSNGTLFSTSLMSPALKFILVILILSICSVLICDIFKIKSKKGMVLIPLILSTFPSLALSFSYLFMVEIYMTSLLLAVFSVWITLKYKYGLIIGSISIALSLGNYQSYIGISVSIIIIYLLQQILNKKDTKILIREILKLFLMGMLGVAIYFIFLKIILMINNTNLSNYKGANSMGIPPINEWPSQIIRTYRHFIGYFIGYSYYKVSNIERIIRILTLFLTFIIVIFTIKKEKLYLKKINLLLLILIVITIPLTFNIVDFMAYKAELTSLQIYPFVMLYIMSIVIIDKTKINNISNIVIILLITISYLNFIQTNKYYYKLETYYNYTLNFNNRLLTRIESKEGYNYDMPIMFIGMENSEFNTRLYNYPTLNDALTFDQALWGGNIIGYADLYAYGNDKKIFKMIENQLGVKLLRATEEERNRIMINSQFKNNINSYPEEESIKIIDGILVVFF